MNFAGGVGRSIGPPAELIVTCRKCGCLSTSSTSLTLAKAICASSSCRASVATSRLAKQAATRPSVSAPVGGARLVVDEARILAEFRPLQNPGAEHRPLPVVLDGDQDRHAIGALEHAVGRQARMREADALGRRAVLPMQQRHGHQLDGGIEHRHADVGALAGASAADHALPGSPRRHAARWRCRRSTRRPGPAPRGRRSPTPIPVSAWISRS